MTLPQADQAEPHVDEHTLWSLAKPIPLHFDQQHLYAHSAAAEYLFESGVWRLKKGGHIRFDRLLNLFPCKKWRSWTGVDGLTMRIHYRGGSCRASVLAYDGQTLRLASATTLPRTREAGVVRIDLSGWPSSASFLFLQFEADLETEILDASIVTTTKPRNAIRLGIAITTFNRPADVEEQVALLEGLAPSGLSYRIFVIDNGRNLEFRRSYANTTVMPSVNLGGAGGFTRGLIEVMADGSFTHGMFMDDDAFCHPEAILRAAALLSYSKRADLALTGAMNYLHAPEIQYELGGRLAAYGVQSVRMNADTNNLRAQYENDLADPPQYGAWWCFIFPLKSVRTFPFPFFVRGDDITFSLQNSFKLETLPGLVAWQPSFEYKIGASVEYLVHRSFLTIPLLAPRTDWTKESILTGIRHAFAMELDGLRYPIAEGICGALEDVMTGPGFWLNASNTTARMQELGRMEKAFSERSLLTNWIFRSEDVEPRRSMRVLRARFGHLNIPARLCWRRPALTNDMFPRKGQAAFRRGMIYHAPDGSRSLSCVRDWRWRRRLERRFKTLTAEYADRFEDLLKAYADQQDALQSLQAWRQRLEIAQTSLRQAARPSTEIKPPLRNEFSLAYPAI